MSVTRLAAYEGGRMLWDQRLIWLAIALLAFNLWIVIRMVAYLDIRLDRFEEMLEALYRLDEATKWLDEDERELRYCDAEGEA